MSVILDRPEPGPRRPGRMVPLAIAALAIAGGGLLFSGAYEGTSDVGNPAALAAADPIALGERVDGLTGTLHVVLDAGNETTYTRWPAARSGPDLIELVEPGARLNADASKIAWMDDLDNLWLGPPGQMRLVALDVDAFAWHDTEPEAVLFTQPVLDMFQIHAGVATPDKGFIATTVAPIPSSVTVTAYGDWGIGARIDRAGADDLLTYNAEGILVHQFTATTAGSATAGGGLVAATVHDTIAFVGSRGRLDLPAPPETGIIRAVDFHPATERAVVGMDLGTRWAVMVISSNGSIEAQANTEATMVRWGEEGRFVFIATPGRELAVLDTWDESLSTVPLSGRVVDLLVVPEQQP